MPLFTKSCPVVVEYLAYRGRGPNPGRYQGREQECFTDLVEAKRRYRTLRQQRIAEEITIREGSYSNVIVAWDASKTRRGRRRG